VATVFGRGTSFAVVPYTGRGRCPACGRGRAKACHDKQTLGVQRAGGLAARIGVPWTEVLEAEGLSLSELAPVEPLSVGSDAAAGRGSQPPTGSW
jgi:threonine dehydrogenase-like Zn-dependent dehydrogenase